MLVISLTARAGRPLPGALYDSAVKPSRIWFGRSNPDLPRPPLQGCSRSPTASRTRSTRTRPASSERPALERLLYHTRDYDNIACMRIYRTFYTSLALAPPILVRGGSGLERKREREREREGGREREYELDSLTSLRQVRCDDQGGLPRLRRPRRDGGGPR
jgi:hypothetical protein